MRGFRITVFVLGFVSFSGELIRHSYVRWVEHHSSVLDKYDQVDKEIKEAPSLAFLDKRYGEEFEKQKAAPGSQRPDQYNPSSAVFKFHQAIIDWERRENEVRELRYYWAAGVVALVLAIPCSWFRNEWLSMALQVVGFVEMAWWTSPSLAGPSREFSRLLENKIVLTFV